MAVSKRGRDEYWNGGLALPDAKGINGGLTLAHGNDLMPFLEKIDNICSPEESDVGIKTVINSLPNEIGLKTQSDHNIDSTNEEEGGADQMGSRKKGELTADQNSQLISDIGDFTYYDNPLAELDFFIDQFTADELGIIMNYADEDSIPDIMYLDAVHSYVETKDVFCGSMWDDDLWQFSEFPVIQNDFSLPQPEEHGINAIEFHDVWN